MTVRLLYREVRDQMRPGDVIAFAGRGLVSRAIAWRTRTHITHVGVVDRVERNGDTRVLVTESTSLDGRIGVVTSYLGKRVLEYSGEVYWLPLSSHVRRFLDLPLFWAWLRAQDGKPYDARGALKAGLDLLDWIPGLGRWTRGTEDYGRLFCSEHLAGAWRSGGLPVVANPAEVTPRDVTEWAIYEQPARQISGDLRPIRRFSTRPILDLTEGA